MAKLERSITINAPVEKVFDYLSDPNNLPEIWPSLVEVKDLQPLPSGGYKRRRVYKMSGIRLEGTAEDVEYIPNQCIFFKNTGGIEGTIAWSFQPEDGGTNLIVEAEYIVPIPVLGKVAEAFVVKINENEAEVFLANLKAKMET